MQRRSGRNGNAPPPVQDPNDLVPTTSTGKRGKIGGGPTNKKKKEQQVEVTRPSLRFKEKTTMKQKELEEIMNTVESEDEDSYDSEETDLMSSPLPRLTKRRPTGSQPQSQPQSQDNREPTVDEKKELRKCTLYIDEDVKCVYYKGVGGEILAMNGTPSIEGHTQDEGYVFCFEEANSKKNQVANSTKKFRMKIFTPQLSDTKTLIASIKTASQQANAGKWLYIRDVETGDKRANFGLLLHEMCETYSALPEEDKFEIPCAPNLGFFKSDYFLVNNTLQFNLDSMDKIAIDDCILVSNIRDSVPFAMSPDISLVDSSLAMREVNTELKRYFHEPQLLVFRAAILWAFISPYLRERMLMTSLPVVCAYGPNNCGKSDRLLVYSACCGVERGRNKKCTANGAKEMMAENTLTFLPLDDPDKNVSKYVIEKGYDGSDNAKIKGNRIDNQEIRRNAFLTNKVVEFDQNVHTKVTFCPEKAIEKERLEENRDLRLTVERLAVSHAPKAVLHNLKFAKLFAEEFSKNHGKYVSDADKVIPASVSQYSRWGTNHAHLCMAINLVLEHESEWEVTYEEVLVYLKDSFAKMVTNLKCYGVKIVPAEGGEKGDISELVETLATYLQNMEGNLKMVLRLTTTVAPTKLVLGIRKAILEKAGVPNFAVDLRSCGYEVADVKNFRFLHENSELNYFTHGAKPMGMSSETTALRVTVSVGLTGPEEPALAPLVKLIRDQEKSDGVTSTGKPVVDATGNVDGEKCEKCKKVGENLFICTGCDKTVYCSERCQLMDWKVHGMRCKPANQGEKKKVRKSKK